MPIFSNWFHGSPSITTNLDTGTFNYWFHGSPLIVPLNNLTTIQGFGCQARIVVNTTRTEQSRARIRHTTGQSWQGRARIRLTTNQSLQSRARICVQTIHTLQARARILCVTDQSWQSRAHILIVPKTLQIRANIHSGATLTTQSMSSKASIVLSITQTYTSKARVQRSQGWPIPSIGDPGYALFVPTQLGILCAITAAGFGEQGIGARANIIRASTYRVSVGADIILNSKIQIKANVQGRQIGSLGFTFSIAQNQTRTLTGVFGFPGTSSSQGFGSIATIVQQKTGTVTNQFALSLKPAIIDRIQTIVLAGSQDFSRQITLGAFIQR